MHCILYRVAKEIECDDSRYYNLGALHKNAVHTIPWKLRATLEKIVNKTKPISQFFGSKLRRLKPFFCNFSVLLLEVIEVKGV